MAAAPELLAAVSYAVAALGAVDPGDVTPATWDLLVCIRETLEKVECKTMTMPTGDIDDVR